jgi:hypothetical protein
MESAPRQIPQNRTPTVQQKCARLSHEANGGAGKPYLQLVGYMIHVGICIAV